MMAKVIRHLKEFKKINQDRKYYIAHILRNK